MEMFCQGSGIDKYSFIQFGHWIALQMCEIIADN